MMILDYRSELYIQYLGCLWDITPGTVIRTGGDTVNKYTVFICSQTWSAFLPCTSWSVPYGYTYKEKYPHDSFKSCANTAYTSQMLRRGSIDLIGTFG